jgi:hypothetical protein
MLPTDATLYDGILALLPNTATPSRKHGPSATGGSRAAAHGRHVRGFFAAIDTYFGAGAVPRRRPVIVSITGGSTRDVIAALRHHGVPLRTGDLEGFYFDAMGGRPVEEIVAHLARPRLGRRDQ